MLGRLLYYILEMFVGVIRELIVSGSGEEDMSALLCGMHAASNDALRLKLHILKALLACLRDSHRTRTIFRKVSKPRYTHYSGSKQKFETYIVVTLKYPHLNST